MKDLCSETITIGGCQLGILAHNTLVIKEVET